MASAVENFVGWLRVVDRSILLLTLIFIFLLGMVTGLIMGELAQNPFLSGGYVFLVLALLLGLFIKLESGRT